MSVKHHPESHAHQGQIGFENRGKPLPWIATVNTFLILDSSLLPEQVRDGLENEFIVASTAGALLELPAANSG